MVKSSKLYIQSIIGIKQKSIRLRKQLSNLPWQAKQFKSTHPSSISSRNQGNVAKSSTKVFLPSIFPNSEVNADTPQLDLSVCSSKSKSKENSLVLASVLPIESHFYNHTIQGVWSDDNKKYHWCHLNVTSFNSKQHTFSGKWANNVSSDSIRPFFLPFDLLYESKPYAWEDDAISRLLRAETETHIRREFINAWIKISEKELLSEISEFHKTFRPQNSAPSMGDYMSLKQHQVDNKINSYKFKIDKLLYSNGNRSEKSKQIAQAQALIETVLKHLPATIQSFKKYHTVNLQQRKTKSAQQIQQLSKQQAKFQSVKKPASTSHVQMAEKAAELSTKFENALDNTKCINVLQELLEIELTNFQNLTQMQAVFRNYANYWIVVSKFGQQIGKQLGAKTPIDKLDHTNLFYQMKNMIRTINDSEFYFRHHGQQQLSKHSRGFISDCCEKFLEALQIVQTLQKANLIESDVDKVESQMGNNFRLRNLDGIITLKSISDARFEKVDQDKFYSLIKSASENSAFQRLMANRIIEKDNIQSAIDKFQKRSTELSSLIASDQGLRVRIRDEVNKLRTSANTAQELKRTSVLIPYLQRFFTLGAHKASRLAPIFEKVDLQAIKKAIDDLRKQAFDSENIADFFALKSTQQHVAKLRSQNDNIHKQAQKLLEQLRKQFPRFYFLSNDDILQILCKVDSYDNIQNITPYLRHFFDQVHDVKFSNDKKTVTQLIQAKGERFKLRHNVAPLSEFKIENYMTNLLQAIRKSVADQIKQSVKNSQGMPMQKWLEVFSSQSQKFYVSYDFTQRVESILSSKDDQSKKFQQLHDKLQEQLHDFVTLIRKSTKSDLISSLCILIVHQRDIVQENFINSSSLPLAVDSFNWLKFIRFYHNGDNDCVGKCGLTKFNYGNEFLGNYGNLVITPLTDQIYLSTMQAYRLSMGHASTGPAGTGKTQTCKDLSRALGKRALVINCSDQIDYIVLSKIIQGTAMDGCWVCMDEFNRICVEVITHFASIMKALLDGLKAKQNTFMSHTGWGSSVECKLDHSCLVNITMNPGYAGRTQLPQVLKFQFLECALIVPDLRLIMQQFLLAQGFYDSHKLKDQIFQAVNLCKDSLTKSAHYDFGLRFQKQVIRLAGLMIQKFQDTKSEYQIIKTVIHDSLIGKLMEQDVPKFKTILQDVFKDGRKIDYLGETLSRHTQLIEAVKQVYPYLDSPEQTQQVVREAVYLHQTLLIRHGASVFGPPGVGKTTLIETLANAYNYLNNGSVELTKIYTKALTYQQIYGFYNEKEQWIDGILSKAMRRISNETRQNVNHWLVLDSEIDPQWIQLLNSLLDDNKMLCLASNERIPLHRNARVIFEVTHFETASPASVSRVGILKVNYPKNKNDRMRSMLMEYLTKEGQNKIRDATEFQNVTQLYKEIVEPVLQYVENSQKVKFPYTNLMRSFLTTFRAVRKPTSDKNESRNQIYFAVILSIGSALGASNKDLLVESLKKSGILPVPANDIFDYAYIDGKWQKWAASHINNPKLNNNFFHTTNSIRSHYYTALNLAQGRDVFVYGPASGKTRNIRYLLQAQGLANVNVVCSKKTTPASVLNRIKSALPASKSQKLVVFLDDLDLIQIDKYGSDNTGHLLTQIINHRKQKLLYNYQTAFHADNVNIIGAAGENVDVSARQYRNYALIRSELDDSQMESLFSQKVHNNFVGLSDSQHLKDLSQAQVKLMRQLNNKFENIYSATLHDAMRVANGMNLVNRATVSNNQDINRLWLHQNIRTFCDRAQNQIDNDNIKQSIKRASSHLIDPKECESLLFGDFTQSTGCPVTTQSKYCQITDYAYYLSKIDYIKSRMMAAKLPQASSVISCDLVLRHTSITRRALSRRDFGNQNLLSVGPYGCGKKYIISLASFLAKEESVEVPPSMLKRESLNQYLKRAGLQNKAMNLVVDLGNNLNEGVVEYIIQAIQCRNLPFLFSQDEQAKIKEQMKANIDYQTFLDNIHRNVRFVVQISPEIYLRLLHSYPSIEKFFTVDFYQHYDKVDVQQICGQLIRQSNQRFREFQKLCIDVGRKIYLSAVRESQTEETTKSISFVNETIFAVVLSNKLRLKEREFRQKQAAIESLGSFVTQNQDAKKGVQLLTISLKSDLALERSLGDCIIQTAKEIYGKHFMVEAQNRLVEQWSKLIFAYKLSRTLGEESHSSKGLGELISSGDRKGVEHFVTNEIILQLHKDKIQGQQLKKAKLQLQQRNKEVNQLVKRVLETKVKEQHMVKYAKARESHQNASDTLSKLMQTYNQIFVHSQPLASRITSLLLLSAYLERSLDNFKFSQEQKATLFRNALKKSRHVQDKNQRLITQMYDVTHQFYSELSNSFFIGIEKLGFAFMIALIVMRGNFNVKREEILAMKKNPHVRRNTLGLDDLVSSAKSLSHLQSLKGFDRFFAQNMEAFVAYAQSQSPESDQLPGKWQTNLNDFLKLLVLKNFRSDRLKEGIQLFVETYLGKEFSCIDDPINLQEQVKNFSFFVIQVNSFVTHPLKLLEKLNLPKRPLDQIKVLPSLGQGVLKYLRDTVAQCNEKGHCLVINKFYVSEAVNSQLEKIVKSHAQKLHPDFRIFILTQSSKLLTRVPYIKRISLSSRQFSLSDKIHFDAPIQTPAKDVEKFNRAVYQSIYVYAVIISRLNLSVPGWVIHYEFETVHLKTLIQQIKGIIDYYGYLNYHVLQHLIVNTNIGGKIRNDDDRLKITTLAEKYLREDSKLPVDFNPQLSQDSILQFIAKLSKINPDELSEVHQNARKIIKYFQCDEIQAFLKRVQNQSSKQLLNRLSSNSKCIKGIIHKNELKYDVNELKELVKKNWSHSALNEFLLQEIERYRGLFGEIHKTLQAVDRDLATSQHSCSFNQLSDASRCILNDRVPNSWRRFRFDSNANLQNAVHQLINSFRILIQICNGSRTINPSCFILPIGFLESILIDYSRKYRVQLHSLSLTIVHDNEKDDQGVAVEGLFLQGAQLNLESFELQDVNLSSPVQKLPVVRVKAVENVENNMYGGKVYQHLWRRGNFEQRSYANVEPRIYVKSRIDKGHWSLKGVGLFFSLDI